MYRIGQQELDAVARVVRSGKAFRYKVGEECATFEKRFAKRLRVKHCVQTASGMNSLTAALVGLGVGPGDEVVVPACTYMATAVAVLAVGAIPVIVDVDESVTLSPEALKDAIGPCTRAVIPVHMWGLPCNMDAILRVARRRKLYVVEDACQAVGGAYEGRMLGSLGDLGAFSFNYYKNMTCGEGGAVVTSHDDWARRVQCAVDCCGFYWNPERDRVSGFTANGARASEFEGAILNAQLDRIDGMIRAMRRQKALVLRETASAGLTPIPANSPRWECGTHILYRFADAAAAERFAGLAGGTVALKTGRHVYTEWQPILSHQGAHHPAMNPFTMPANRRCRKRYAPDQCARSLDILGRTVFFGTHPDRKDREVMALVKKLRDAAKAAAGAG